MTNFKVGDKVVKTKLLVGGRNREWPVGTRGEVIEDNGRASHSQHCEVKDEAFDEIRNCEMKYWELEIEGDLPARAGNMSLRDPARQNNDNRDTCYACGALTKPVNTGFSVSIMRVCTKCKK